MLLKSPVAPANLPVPPLMIHWVIENGVQAGACHDLFGRRGGLIHQDRVARLRHEMMLHRENRRPVRTGGHIENRGRDRSLQLPVDDTKCCGLVHDAKIGHHGSANGLQRNSEGLPPA